MLRTRTVTPRMATLLQTAFLLLAPFSIGLESSLLLGLLLLLLLLLLEERLLCQARLELGGGAYKGCLGGIFLRFGVIFVRYGDNRVAECLGFHAGFREEVEPVFGNALYAEDELLHVGDLLIKIRDLIRHDRGFVLIGGYLLVEPLERGVAGLELLKA